MGKQQDRIAEALERIAVAIEAIAANGMRPTHNRTHEVGGKVKSSRLSQCPPNYKPCRICKKVGPSYIGGRGIGLCCRGKRKSQLTEKGEKSKTHLTEKPSNECVKCGRPRHRGRCPRLQIAPQKAEARAKHPDTEHEPIAERPKSAPPPVTKNDIRDAVDFLSSYVYRLRDRSVGDKEILWEITRRSKEKGMNLTDEQADQVYREILRNPRPM